MIKLFLMLIISLPVYAGTYLSTVRGMIVEGDSDIPVENAVVRITELDITDVTDNKGMFEFSKIEYGSYTLTVQHVAYKTHREVLEVDKDKEFGIIIHIYPRAIETSQIVVTGKHTDSRFDDYHELANVLKGKELERDLGSTLGASLKNETGLAVRSMGPAPARPVIRGLGGDRVMINEDGNNTSDLSATSPDHAVAMEPFLVERFEVIRGPKVLLKSSTSLGGIVNVIRNDIPTELPQNITGVLGGYGESANKGYLGAASLQVPLQNFVVKGEISKRQAGDLSTPAGVLRNSDLTTLSYSGGGGYIWNSGSAGLSIREFQSDYGVPGGFVGAHPNGVDISMFKREATAGVNLTFASPLVTGLVINLGRDYYRHKEFESAGIIGSEFTIFHYQGNADINTGRIGLLSGGTLGISYEQRDFNIGGYVFTTPAVSRKASAYFYQQGALGDFSFEIGGRYSYDNIEPKAGAIPGVSARERSFGSFSASASLIYEIVPQFFGGFNINSSSRVPTIEELYSRGPHLAAYSYEVGNENLGLEKGTGSEIFLYYKSSDFFGMVTYFRNDMSYYIIPRNSGRMNYATLLPIYETAGVPALMHGAESRMEYKLSSRLKVNLNVSYTYGKLKNSGTPLPMIPPLKGIAEIIYSFTDFNIGITAEASAEQNRIDLFEQPTAGYAVLNTFAQYSLISGNNIHNFTVNIDNIFNKEYRNHLSRVKVIMPESGRSARLIYRFYF